MVDFAAPIDKNNRHSCNGIDRDADGLKCSECSTVLKYMMSSFFVFGIWIREKGEQTGRDRLLRQF